MAESSTSIDQFLKIYVQDLQEGHAAIFAGAGLSMGAGFVDWTTLLKPLAEELQLDIERESRDLTLLAQHYVTQQGGSRHRLQQLLIDEFPAETKPTENHQLLARLPIGTFWTTNYDALIETALRNEDKRPDVLFRVQHLTRRRARRDAVVYKMHGDASCPEEAVLTKEDYERYAVERSAFTTALCADLSSKTFLFIGFSFQDPNLDVVLSRLRQTFGVNARPHYCVLRKAPSKDDSESRYLARKHNLLIAELSRLHVRPLLVENYAEIPDILRRIGQAFRRKTVFVSASVRDFETDKELAQAEELMFELGKMLMRKGFRLVTGMGRGVGGFLISGAVSGLMEQRGSDLYQRLILRPFPRQIDERQKPAVYARVRGGMASMAGLALFLFGRPRSAGTKSHPSGVPAEYDIAKEHGCLLAPIGGTGGGALELWNDQRHFAQDNMPPGFTDALAGLGQHPSELKELLPKIEKLLDCV